MKWSWRKLGTPPSSEWPQNAVIERSFYPSYLGQPIRRIAPKLPPDAAKLVKNMLAFLPEARPSCAEALCTEYFRQKHNPCKNDLSGVDIHGTRCLCLSTDKSVNQTIEFALEINLDSTPTSYHSLMGYNEVARKSGHQHYPQNIIHTFDTEHLCQAQCHVPCSMKHISDLMMQRWLCPVKYLLITIKQIGHLKIITDNDDMPKLINKQPLIIISITEKDEWNIAPSEDHFLTGFTTIMATVICLAIFGVFLLICITCLIRIHCCKCRRSNDA
ncbi:BMA-CDK-4, isoform a [Dirofilaria immitis]|nr:BMA-CDK-4, isoform a [Dirofilaria immitis]